MKKIQLIFILFLSFLNIHAQESNNDSSDFHHCLFEEKSFTIGLGSAFNLIDSKYEFNGRLYYNLKENFCFGPEYYTNFQSDKKLNELNFVGHYIFDLKAFGLYPLVGISYIDEKISHESISKIGLVSGGGIHRNIKRFIMYFEFDYALYNRFNSIKISAGIAYMFKH